MKKCLTLLLNLVVVSSFAQFDFIPKPTEAKFEMGLVPALSIQVFQGDISAVQKSWENVLKKKEAKVSSSKMGMKAENAVFPEISSTSVNVHTSFKELEESVIEMTVAFDLGSAILDSANYPDKYQVAKGMLFDFSESQTRMSIDAALKEASKQLKRDQSDLEKLQKDKEKLEGSIADWQKEIEKAKGEIEENLKSQEAQTKKLENQQAVVKGIEWKKKALSKK